MTQLNPTEANGPAATLTEPEKLEIEGIPQGIDTQTDNEFEIQGLAYETRVLKDALVALLKLSSGATFQERKAAIGEDAFKLIRDQLVRKSKKTEKKIVKPRSNASEPTPESGIEAKLLYQQEEVRQQLRDAATANEIQTAIDLARKLGMNFEVGLGEKKLSKLSSTTVSSRE